ncbi:MAG TPA: hypothetical protein VFX03_01130, partial [Thermomicrobiales bacterium]|nr:hypothetical protein [Thermomicrobiales bacterium]
MLMTRSAEGKLRGVWVSYACHCVTLSNNKLSGDWAGYAQEIIEREHPGCVALVSIGCGADQNPISGVTGDKVDVAQGQGAEIAAEVNRLLKTDLKPVGGPLAAERKEIELTFDTPPSRARFEELAKQTNAVGYHAQVQLARLDRGEKLQQTLAYPVESWTFGDDLAIVFLPGEVVVDYSLRLKSELDRSRLWINSYANDAPWYIPSERVLKEGGYEGAVAMTYYDRPTRFKPGLEQQIVDAVHEQIGQRFGKNAAENKRTETRPLSPEKSLAAIRPKPGMNVELVVAEPLIADPVAIDFGPDGRLWVAEMHDYPSGLDRNYQPGGRVRLVTDADGDGRYDASSVFLDGIPFPTGVTAWRGGVLVCAAP